MPSHQNFEDAARGQRITSEVSANSHLIGTLNRMQPSKSGINIVGAVVARVLPVNPPNCEVGPG